MNEVAGRGPRKLLANVVALDDVATDDSDNRSLKNTDDTRNQKARQVKDT